MNICITSAQISEIKPNPKDSIRQVAPGIPAEICASIRSSVITSRTQPRSNYMAIRWLFVQEHIKSCLIQRLTAERTFPAHFASRRRGNAMICRSTWQGLKLTVKLTDLRKKGKENLMKTTAVIGARDKKKKRNLDSGRHGNRAIGLITVSTLFVIGRVVFCFFSRSTILCPNNKWHLHAPQINGR